jgi:hypothetical protein
MKMSSQPSTNFDRTVAKINVRVIGEILAMADQLSPELSDRLSLNAAIEYAKIIGDNEELKIAVLAINKEVADELEAESKGEASPLHG